MMYTESSEDDIDGARCDLGLPPRPPSTRSKEKMFDCVSPSPDMSCPTPSSGHFSGGSATSKSAGQIIEMQIFKKNQLQHVKDNLTIKNSVQ